MSIRMGFDPGTTHVGIAAIDPAQSNAKVIQIEMCRLPDPMDRINAIQWILNDCQFILPAKFDVVIEAAAFDIKGRQSELEQIRTSAALWFQRYGGQCYFAAPMTIRKYVFGNGRIKAHEVWEGLEPDCLAALSCAYYIK